MNVKAIKQNGIVQTLCRMCDTRCAINVHLKDGVITDITPFDHHPVNQGRMCPRGSAAIDLVYHPLRILKPLKRQPDGTFNNISWERALDEVAEKMLRLKEKFGARSMGVWRGGGVGF